jgi:hypothetical protein
VRGRHRAHVGLLQTGVDLARRLGKLAPRRHIDVGAFIDRSVDLAGHDYHYATALGSDDASFEHYSSSVTAG